MEIRSSLTERMNRMVFRLIAISSRLKAFVFQSLLYHRRHSRHLIVSESQRKLELELSVFDYHQMSTTHRNEAVQECIDYLKQSASLEAS